METRYILTLYLGLFGAYHCLAQPGNALVLDGCNNFLEVAESDLLDFDQVISIECWIKPNCADENRMIVSKQWCAGDYGYYLSVFEGKLFWSYSISGSCTFPNGYQTVDNPILPHVFTHVAVVHSASYVKLFINGTEVPSELYEGQHGTIRNSSQPFRIGAYYTLPQTIGSYFSGLIDEIRVWNIELTESLINLRKDIPLSGSEPGLILYFDMEDPGQGSNLTLINRSTYGSAMDAMTAGYTSYSPYIMAHEEYDVRILDLGDDIMTCDEFVALSIDPGNYKQVLWSNGEFDYTISPMASGVYSVLVERELCKFFYDTIVVEFIGTVHESQDYTICENDSITINNTVYDQEGIYFDTVSSNTVCDTIFEYNISTFATTFLNLVFDACPDETIIYNSQELSPGTLTTFVLESVNGCDSIVTVEVHTFLTINEEVNLFSCDGELIEFDGMLLFPNSITDFHYVSLASCDSIVTVHVQSIPASQDFLGDDIVTCARGHLLVSPNTQTVWHDGTVAQSLNVSASGTYSATFIDSFGCMNADTINVTFVQSGFYIPNIFSPNEDGINDCFRVYSTHDIPFSGYRMTIYDRWGEEVFASTDPDDCWSGKFKDQIFNSGVYVWVIQVLGPCDESQILSGDVALVR